MAAMPDAESMQEVGGTKMIEASVDEPIRIHLWEDRTRGELWVPTYDPAGLALLADEYLRIAGNNAVDNGHRTFEFQAMKPGTYVIVFEKRMGWKFTAEDRRAFRVVVSQSTPHRVE
jgi:predicted secreted protein